MLTGGRRGGSLVKIRLGTWEKRILVEMYKWMLETEKWNLAQSAVRWLVLAKRIGAYPNSPIKEMSPNYRLWHLAKKSMYRVVDAGLVQVVPSEMPVKRFGNTFFRLTEEGKEVARRIMIEEEAEGDLEKAISIIKAEGVETFTLPLVREELWNVAGWKFKNREEFEEFWSNQRFGKLLEKLIRKGIMKRLCIKGARKYSFPAESTA
jgi:hypothetical protein